MNQPEVYNKYIKSGEWIDMGTCFIGGKQGWMVPEYMIKGDESRGIKPMAPDLKSVYDLPKYWELFKDPENPSKGRIYSCAAGWPCVDFLEMKLDHYGLRDTFQMFVPGSGPGIVASMVAAYKKGEPWIGYYWEPTAALGKYSMIFIDEPEYDPVVWEKDKSCSFPPAVTSIVVNGQFPHKAPDLIGFLRRWELDVQLVNKLLAYMEDNKKSTDETAIYFLKNYESVWSNWVETDKIEIIKNALK